MADKKKKRGKAAWGSILYIVICAVFGGIIGVMLAENDVALDLTQILLIMVFFMLAVLLHLILHEAGHMFAGLMSGYKFLSFRIGSFMWEKQKDGNIRFSKYSLAGTGGQCLMCPPEYNNGNFPFVLYNLGGVIMNFLLAALAAAIALLVPVGPWMKVFLWMMVFVGVLTGLVNGIPFKSKTVNNDGSNTLTIGKSLASRRAFWLQMRINEEGAYGVRLKDMPEDWFQVQEGEKNAMISSVQVFKANRMMDGLRFEEAEELMEILAKDKEVPGVYRNLITFDLAYCELIKGADGEAVEKLQEKEMQAFAKMMKNFPSVIRTQYAVALLHDKNPEEAEKRLKQFEKMTETYPRSCDLVSEREMIRLAQEKAKNDSEAE